jgi:Acetyltransferase (GNAT) domain
LALTVEALEALPAGEWDGLVEASQAPPFYRAAALAAYARAPLLPFSRLAYLVCRERPDGPALAGLPAYLLEWLDPLGVLAELVPTRCVGRPVLLSHFWHCYDTRIPARRLGPDVVAALCDRLAACARAMGAAAYGFLNVAEPGLLLPLLRGAGLDAQRMDTRFVLPLDGLETIDAYLAGIRPRARQEMRRHWRRAMAAGARVSLGRPEPADLAEAARLCRLTAAKHGNDGWYPEGPLIGMMCALEQVRLLWLRVPAGPAAVGVCFHDGDRFHNWAVGLDYAAAAGFSPYSVLTLASVSTAMELGCRLLEAGRRNDWFKLRYGMSAVPLYACLGTT